MSRFLQDMEIARRCARIAGQLLLREFLAGSEVRSDVGKDIKLAADSASEEAILRELRANSGHPILSEEAGGDPGLAAGGVRWIVDPLDGTLNFSRRLPLCCVSIGLADGETPILGVIYDFLGDILYSGGVGEGATANDQPLQVSMVDSADRAVICTGFPSGRAYDDASLEAFTRKIQNFKKVRLLGSAALSLAHVAAGHADAYYEDGINLWDVTAGLAIVASAGGQFEIRPSHGTYQREIFASNGRILRPSVAEKGF